MSTASETYTLPADPRANACGAFFDELKSFRGRPIVIDASLVERMDTLVAQVILFGQKTWAADSVPFTVSNPSEAMVTALDRLALTDAITFEEGSDVN